MSIDGQVFSQSLINYAVIGPAVGLASAPPILQLQAALEAQLGLVTVYAVDVYGRRLLEYASGEYQGSGGSGGSGGRGGSGLVQ